jgi:CheY-like chemotaxis protein
MSVKLLDVGQCVPDHAAIRRLVESNFDASVVQTDQLDDTLAALRSEPFALVLINRKLDIDYSEGMDILRAIKADSALNATPVMIVTNYAEHQQAAITAGAEPGFGKSHLGDPATLEKLARFLPRK